MIIAMIVILLLMPILIATKPAIPYYEIRKFTTTTTTATRSYRHW